MIQIRCLYEGMPVEEMLADWGTILPQRMAQWGLERAKVRRGLAGGQARGRHAG